MIKITIRQCAYFRAVAQTGGIASAAQAIGISQPAVAQAIRKLEDITGLVLFRRLHARGMELTAQGGEFLRYAENLLAYASPAADLCPDRATPELMKLSAELGARLSSPIFCRHSCPVTCPESSRQSGIALFRLESGT